MFTDPLTLNIINNLRNDYNKFRFKENLLYYKRCLYILKD